MNGMATEKEQLARDLKKLQDQMQASSRNMAGTQPGASSKLREALAEAQQNEIESHMRKSAELIRRGQGIYTWPWEPQETMGLDRLSEQVHEAQSQLRPGEQQSGQKPGAGDDQLARALDQLEKTRQRMQEMADASQRGNQGGKQQGGQRQSGQLQRGGQQPGSQQGQGQQPGSQQGGQQQ